MTVLQIIVLVVMTILSSLFYWAGGRGRDFSKGFFFKSIVRDLGCSLTFLICGSLIIEWSLISQGLLVLSSLILFGTLTTYNKWLNKLFGRKDEKLDALTFGFTGLTYGLAALPLAFANTWLPGIFIRIFVLMLSTGLLGLMHGQWKKQWLVHLSEILMGASIIGTLPLLFIGE